MKLIEKIIDFLENSPLTFRTWLLSFSALMVVRILIENIIFNSLKDQRLVATVSFFSHIFLFFLLLYLILLIFLRFITKEKVKKIANILLWGYWIMLLPPILDAIIFKGKDVWSFYYFGGLKELGLGFLTFFGSNLSVGITLGSRIMIISALLALIIYVSIKTKSVGKVIFSAFCLYLIFFIFGSFPSFVAIFERILEGQNILTINSLDVASIFLVPADFFSLAGQSAKVSIVYRTNLVYGIFVFVFLVVWQFFNNKEKFWALAKNVRYPQMIFNGGLLLLGVGLGWFYYPENFNLGFFEVLILINLVLVVFSSWFFSVFPNDFNDLEIDKITNADRPLVRKIFSSEEYKNYALIFLVFSLLVSAVINIKIFLLVACYHFLTYLYSCYPFRIKRFIGVASFLSSFASMLFLVCGFILISDNQSLEKFPFQVGLLLFLGFMVMIPLKDIKDMEGDKKNGVFTLPVLLGVKNARLVLSVVLFFTYFFSIYILNEKKLFLPALIFGSASFWLVSNDKIPARQLNWWVLLFVFLYGLSIVKIIFL